MPEIQMPTTIQGLAREVFTAIEDAGDGAGLVVTDSAALALALAEYFGVNPEDVDPSYKADEDDEEEDPPTARKENHLLPGELPARLVPFFIAAINTVRATRPGFGGPDPTMGEARKLYDAMPDDALLRCLEEAEGDLPAVRAQFTAVFAYHKADTPIAHLLVGDDGDGETD